MALLEKAAGQGHVYAMGKLAGIHFVRKECEQAVKWNIKGAEAGLPAGAYTRSLLSSTPAVLVTPPCLPLSNRLGEHRSPNVSNKICLR